MDAKGIQWVPWRAEDTSKSLEKCKIVRHLAIWIHHKSTMVRHSIRHLPNNDLLYDAKYAAVDGNCALFLLGCFHLVICRVQFAPSCISCWTDLASGSPHMDSYSLRCKWNPPCFPIRLVPRSISNHSRSVHCFIFGDRAHQMVLLRRNISSNCWGDYFCLRRLRMLTFLHALRQDIITFPQRL